MGRQDARQKEWGEEVRDEKNGEMRRETKKNGETRRETQKWGDER